MQQFYNGDFNQHSAKFGIEEQRAILRLPPTPSPMQVRGLKDSFVSSTALAAGGFLTLSRKSPVASAFRSLTERGGSLSERLNAARKTIQAQMTRIGDIASSIRLI